MSMFLNVAAEFLSLTEVFTATYIDDPVFGVMGIGATDVQTAPISNGLNYAYVVAAVVIF